MKFQNGIALFVLGAGLGAKAEAAKTDLVDFTIVARVQFSVPGDWPVLATKSTREKTVFVFQLPNPADEGTADSTNLSIIAVDLKTVQDRDAFQKQRPGADHIVQQKSVVDGWDCGTFAGPQGSTQYEVWDCRRLISDVGVSVRVAWPHLPKSPPDYDSQMGTVLSNFLMSVGPYKGLPKSGVLRHPEN